MRVGIGVGLFVGFRVGVIVVGFFVGAAVDGSKVGFKVVGFKVGSSVKTFGHVGSLIMLQEPYEPFSLKNSIFFPPIKSPSVKYVCPSGPVTCKCVIYLKPFVFSPGYPTNQVMAPGDFFVINIS